MSIRARLVETAKRLREFLRNSDANVAMLFAIALIPVTIGAGAGVDLARAMIVKSNLTESLDAAALAVGASSGLTQTQMTTLAQNYFNANYKTDASFGTPTPVAIVVSGQSVTVSSSVPVPTILMSAVGINTVNVASTSMVVWGQTKLWVSLVLDNTGSMTQSDSTGTTKISALKTAAHQLLGMLQTAAANAGDVQAAIIPFSKTVNVGTSNAGATWIDWTDWEAAPPGGTPATSVGPGSSCPWSTFSNGFTCTTGATNGASTTSTVPSSGLICPGVRSTNASTGQGGHYFNGCYNSVPTQTSTTTTVVTTTTKITTQSCSQTGAGAITCNTTNTKTTNLGSPTTTTNTVVTSGYSGDSGPTTTTTTPSSTVDGSKSCSGSGNNRRCTWTRTITDTSVATTVTAVGVGPWNHTWVVNDHTTWGGCIMDRTQDYDTNNTAPTNTATRFPAENAQSCVPSQLNSLSYNWTALNSQIDAMSAGGSTNQTIGLAWGWQAFTGGNPLNAPTLPANTSRYIILVSDGLNTQDRYGGDGSNQSTTVDGRMAAACTNAKADGIVIYTVFVDLNGTQGNSTVLQNCASDSSKYFDLTTSGAIISTLAAIGQQITNLRVAQ